MGNVAKYQHGWNMTFTVVELLMIIPKSTYLSISLPYFSIYHFFSLTLYHKTKDIMLNKKNKVSETMICRYIYHPHLDSRIERYCFSLSFVIPLPMGTNIRSIIY